MTQDFSRLWSSQNSSGNRSDSPEYLSRKASESLSILQDYCGYVNQKVTDLGCGAGELLVHLCDKLNISIAVDYSASMLSQCEKNLSTLTLTSRPKLLLGGLNCVAQLDSQFIISTGALSQYSSYSQIQDIFKTFSENKISRHLILFDTIDPFRFSIYRLIAYKNSFDISAGSGILDSLSRESPFDGNNNNGHAVIRFAKYLYINFITIVAFVRVLFSFLRVIELPGSLMGYGVCPSVWRATANEYGFRCQIASSREFEYRYHVIISK